MPQSLVQIYGHIVLSTKERRSYLKNRPFRKRFHAYLASACNAQGCPCLQVGGVEDHGHLLLRLGRTADVASLVREIKRGSSKSIKAELKFNQFQWQNGYAALSISPTHVDAAIVYVRNQEQRHRHHQESFQDELRRFCVKRSTQGALRDPGLCCVTPLA